MRSFTLLTLILVIAIAALLANTYRLQNQLIATKRQGQLNVNKIARLQVQLMDPVFARMESQDIGKLIDNPDGWLAPLVELINSDPKLAELLKEVGLKPSDSDSTGAETFDIYCNPVNDDPNPYEVFTLKFAGDRCTSIERMALYAW